MTTVLAIAVQLYYRARAWGHIAEGRRRRPGLQPLVSSREPDETRLAGKDIVAAARAGRFRISAHFYNTEEEIDRCLAELAALSM